MLLGEAFYNLALNYIKKGDFEECMKYLVISCKRKNPKALSFIGDYHYINKHYEYAYKYYNLSLENDENNSEIYYKLANCYIKGYGTSINKNKAFIYYKKAIEKGNKDAIHFLHYYKSIDNKNLKL